ncbi:MAG: copper resistance protein CopC [Gemmatimonadaceae bacterium]|nr:copper resistance protein CopC [Gemmatimonadaceae bacterium]
MRGGPARRRAAALLLLVIAPVAAGAAARHLKLLRSEPMANQALTASPVQVKLWFSQRPELAVTSIKVTSGVGAAAVERALAPLSRASAPNSPITAPVGAALAPGHYQVVWRTMARDGHVLNGVIPFDVGAPR